MTASRWPTMTARSWGQADAWRRCSGTRKALTGQPVESLVPAELRGRHCDDRAGYARAPVSRAMAHRTRLVGIRKDRATVPVTITLSPVPTASGHLILAVVRDATRALRPDDLASLARAAASDHKKHSEALLDRASAACSGYCDPTRSAIMASARAGQLAPIKPCGARSSRTVA